MLNKQEKASEITSNLLFSLKKVIHTPIFYSEFSESGNAETSLTEFGEVLEGVIYTEVFNGLKEIE